MERGRRPAPSAPPPGLRLLKWRIPRLRRELERALTLLKRLEEARAAGGEDLDPEVESAVLVALRLTARWTVEAHRLWGEVLERVERELQRRPTERRLLRFLKAQPRGEVEGSYRELAERISASRWATFRAVKRLERNGELEVIRRGHGRGSKTLFRLVKRPNCIEECEQARFDSG